MNPSLGIPRAIRMLGRPAAMVAIWMTATGFFGMAYFVSGGRRARVEDAVTFTLAFGIATAVSAVTAMAVGVKRRWAFEAALPITGLIAALIGGAWLFAALAPAMGWGVGSGRVFSGYGGSIPASIVDAAWRAVPTGLIVGAIIGAAVGIAIVVGRSRPGLVLSLAGLLLLVCVVGSGHNVAFVRAVDFVVQLRLAGADRFEANWTLRRELASAIGVTAGAVVGAFLVVGGVRLTRRQPGSLSHE